MSSPSVSVCIPVYQGGRYLHETIQSVLDQSYRDFELVVLDNASTDRTADIVRSFDDPRMRLEQNEQTCPPQQNWDRATRLCTGPLIKLLCADDLLHPRCLEHQVPVLQDDSSLAVVACRRNMIDEKSRIVAPHRGLYGLIGRHTSSDVARQVVRSGMNPIGESASVLFRREDFEAVGGWDGPRVTSMDLEMWVQLLQHGDFLGQPATLASFRLRRGSFSSVESARMYEDLRNTIDRISSEPNFRVRERDRRVGRLRAPLGRLRRQAVFALSRLSSGRKGNVPT